MKKILLTMLSLFMVFGVASAQEDEEWTQLQKGTVSLRLGYFMPSGESDLWTENTDTFTFVVEDFNSFSGGVELNWFVNKYITVGLAVDFYTNTESTEYRDFVGEDNLPILQDLKLSVVPVTGTVKFTPFGNGAPGYSGRSDTPIVPWIGGGVGIYGYQYEEVGEFIDFTDDSIFASEFISEDEVGFGVHAAAGVVVPVGYTWDVFGEARYTWAEADLSEDFLGFEPIDLGGFSFFFGASYRY